MTHARLRQRLGWLALGIGLASLTAGSAGSGTFLEMP
jgi:hypothetical protein